MHTFTREDLFNLQCAVQTYIVTYTELLPAGKRESSQHLASLNTLLDKVRLARWTSQGG
jgi:hypothetical protein